MLSHRFFQEKRTDIIVSSAIRRYFRLVIPVLVSVWVVYALLLVNSFVAYKDVLAVTYSPLKTDYSVLSKNWLTVWKFALYDAFFAWDSRYNPVLWTMAYELFGSFLVFSFLALFGTARNRYLIYVFLLLYLQDSYFSAFLLGLILSDLVCHWESLIAQASKKLTIPALLIGLYLGSYPYIDPSDTIYDILDVSFLGLDSIVVNHTAGACLVMIALLGSPRLQRLFSSRLFLFLGEISFSLYLLHFTIMCSLSTYLFTQFTERFDYHTSVLLSTLATLPVMLAASFVMYKYVDAPAIQCSKQIYHRFFRQNAATMAGEWKEARYGA